MRQWTNADIEPFADMNADPQVMEYFLSTTPRERSYELVKMLRDDIEKNRYGWFVLERKDTPGFAGMMAIDDVRYEVPYHPRREIGWRLPLPMWGHGYATEAANGLLEYAFETLRWPHIIAMTVHSNARSRRVMERIGMTYDANDDFEHPRIPNTHPLHPSVLYRKSAPWANDCPECGSTDIVRIMYGLPTIETEQAAQRGEVALGGCVINAAQPERLCRTCGQRF